jgi:FAD/FMN-containing dehydrogenase
MRVIRTRDLDESLRVFAETDRDHRYSVAWIDCLARGRALGRSVIMLGNDAPVERLPGRRQRFPFQASPRLRWSVPLDAPGWLLGRSSVRAFNALYYTTHLDTQRIIDYEAYFYPLDHIGSWNRLYGRRGFLQYQALFPRDTSARGLRALLETMARGRHSSFLAVLKSTGGASQGMLSYAFPGHTLALDIPLAGEDGTALTRKLDELLLSHGGRLYLAKDATTTACAFATMYPSLPTFRAVKERLDPEGRFVSTQARRVGIV